MTYLIVTVLADVLGVLVLGKAQGWTHPVVLVGGVTVMIVGFVAFSLATRTISTSIANAIWAGTSLVLVIVISRAVSHETLSFGQWMCVALIVLGATGLALLTKGQM